MSNRSVKDETLKNARLGVPDSQGAYSKPHWRHYIGLFEGLQTLSGMVAILLVPLLWASWSKPILIWVLGGIFIAAALFTGLSFVLQRYEDQTK